MVFPTRRGLYELQTFYKVLKYRVFKKEGPKVLGFYTTKNWTVEGLIWTTSTQNLIFYIMVFKHVSLKFIMRYLYFNRNLADLGYFRSTLANLLHQNAFYRLIWYSRAPAQVFMGSIAMESRIFLLLGKWIMTLFEENVQFNLKVLFQGRFWLLEIYP